MAVKYVFVRIKREDYERIMQKKEGLRKDMEAILGKKISFSNPQFFQAFAKGVLEINPENAINIVKLKKFGGGFI